jgi:sugar lactone lactonase YvrE
MKKMLRAALGAFALGTSLFAIGGEPTVPLPRWTFDPAMIFPADRSLMRPEDGVALPDGRLMVADQAHGLRLLNADGSSRPFGRFAEAGYQHQPPDIVGGANGVTLEPAGKHVLVADVFRGGIYRVDIATESTERVHQHPSGVNVACADRKGGIWFTQSTRERDLFRAVDRRIPDGALCYLPPARAGQERASVTLVDGLEFANGMALDEATGFLYLAETSGGRILRFRFDSETGQVSERTVLLSQATAPGLHPDNIELDGRGRLWFAQPLSNKIQVLDLTTGALHTALHISTPQGLAITAEIEARLQANASWLELLTPALWEPSPVAMTGMILSSHDGPVYVTGLGNALIKLPR